MQLWYLAVAIVVIIGVVLALASARPSDFSIKRSLQMAAAPSKPFALVNDLHRWNDWSPWAKLDPQMKQTFAGPETGPGSSMTWTGNNKVGKGTSTIVETTPDQLIQMQLQFVRPFKATNQATFTFTPADSGTNVTWAMTGHCNFGMKVFGLFMNMDKMIGKDFEKGLAQMKGIVEA
jgi:uncharacterized protein YndB with AHSA1/START domain